MTDQGTRYDRIVEGYAKWWAPVLRPAAVRVLDIVAAALEGHAPGDVAADPRPSRLVDVGTGTGTVAIAAAERWPGVEVVGVDASDGMLAAARRDAERRLGVDPLGAPGSGPRRLVLLQGAAESLPPEAADADAVVSSFVYQLVPSRTRALEAAFRVLRPGGRLAYVTWLDGESAFGADEVFDDALEAVGLEPRGDAEDDGRAGDVPSVRAAAAQLRRAGLRQAHAHEDVVAYDFTPESYLGFLAEFDEEDLFRSLEAGVRARLEAEVLARLRARPAGDLRMELPIVYATAVRPR